MGGCEEITRVVYGAILGGREVAWCVTSSLVRAGVRSIFFWRGGGTALLFSEHMSFIFVYSIHEFKCLGMVSTTVTCSIY